VFLHIDYQIINWIFAGQPAVVIPNKDQHPIREGYDHPENRGLNLGRGTGYEYSMQDCDDSKNSYCQNLLRGRFLSVCIGRAVCTDISRELANVLPVEISFGVVPIHHCNCYYYQAIHSSRCR